MITYGIFIITILGIALIGLGFVVAYNSGYEAGQHDTEQEHKYDNIYQP